MFSKEKALKIAVITLFVVAGVDIIRGYMHTFNVWYASEHIAQMTQTADTMHLMITFGISNYLTGFIYILIGLKAKDIAPYVLILIPTSYLIGTISMVTTGVSDMASETSWNGIYMLLIYWSVIILISSNYFVAAYKEKKEKGVQNEKNN